MREMLNSLIDQVEATPGAKVRARAIDWNAFPTVADAEEFQQLLRQLEKLETVKLTFGKKGLRDRIEKVSILDPVPIYSMLGRTPAANIAAAAIAPLRERAEPWEAGVLDEIQSLWSKNRQWQKFTPANADALLDIQKLAQAISSGQHENKDFRTFSSRIVGDSKKVERSEAAVMAYLRANGIGSFRSLMAEQGAWKITMPVMLSGPISLNGLRLCDAMDYVGVPILELENLVVDENIDYILSIENLTSFHRHCVDVNPLPRRGLVLFTSGQPSHAFKEYYSGLVTRFLGKVPFYHWSDIDGGGLEITKVMFDLNHDLRPHLMDVDLLEKHGKPSARIIENTVPFEGWLKPLAEHLAQVETKVLEQEVIDPALPIDSGLQAQ
jgi:hypothetical protein